MKSYQQPLRALCTLLTHHCSLGQGKAQCDIAYVHSGDVPQGAAWFRDLLPLPLANSHQISMPCSHAHPWASTHGPPPGFRCPGGLVPPRCPRCGTHEAVRLFNCSSSAYLEQQECARNARGICHPLIQLLACRTSSELQGVGQTVGRVHISAPSASRDAPHATELPGAIVKSRLNLLLHACV